jgi:hypothetical protein
MRKDQQIAYLTISKRGRGPLDEGIYSVHVRDMDIANGNITLQVKVLAKIEEKEERDGN